MEFKPIKILIIEDDFNDCRSFEECAKAREDIEIVAITDSDVEGLKFVKTKRPEGIILDLELNNSATGSIDSLDFLSNLKKLNLNYEPIVIVIAGDIRISDIVGHRGEYVLAFVSQPPVFARCLRSFQKFCSVEYCVGGTIHTSPPVRKRRIEEILLDGQPQWCGKTIGNVIGTHCVRTADGLERDVVGSQRVQIVETDTWRGYYLVVGLHHRTGWGYTNLPCLHTTCIPCNFGATGMYVDVYITCLAAVSQA